MKIFTTCGHFSSHKVHFRFVSNTPLLPPNSTSLLTPVLLADVLFFVLFFKLSHTERFQSVRFFVRRKQSIEEKNHFRQFEKIRPEMLFWELSSKLEIIIIIIKT